MPLLRTRVTTLEMREVPAGDGEPWPAGFEDWRLAEEPRMALDRYRALYEAVGREHHWTSRIQSDDHLAREIHAPSIRLFALTGSGGTAGWFEIETHRERDTARIVHFAILPEFRGLRLAGPLLDRAIRIGFSNGTRLLRIETNTLDHPAALALYRARGFVTVAEREVLTPAIESAGARGTGTS